MEKQNPPLQEGEDVRGVVVGLRNHSDKGNSAKSALLCIAAVIALAVVGLGLFSAGKSAGREQSQLDRMDGQLQSLFQSRQDLEKRIDELERWRNHWGGGGAAGATPQ